MKTKILMVVAFVLAAGAILYLTQVGGRSSGTDHNVATTEAATEVLMVYSTEKKEWIEASAAGFQKEHPEIKLTLIGKGSFDSAQAILEGKDKPTIWSPADSLALRLMEADWKTQYGTELFALEGDDAPQPLVLTPLVFAVWEDRAQALLASAGGHMSWKSIQAAVSTTEGWPKVGGKAEWGFVRLGHTDPTRSNSGLQALYSMSLEYHGKTTLAVADVLDQNYQKWMTSIEKGVSKFEASTGTFMTDMVRFGPSKYDIAVVYENLAIEQIENAQGRWGNLRIYYPSTTLWSDHPVALLKGDWVTPEKRAAARLWIAHLKSHAVQGQALVHGFRPADPGVPLKSTEADNPFTRLADYGIKLELPPAAQSPEGAVVRNLLTLWTRTMKPGN